MVPMTDIGSDNGIPQEKVLRALEWGGFEHFPSVGDRTETSVYGYEPRGQKGRTSRGGGGEQLGVDLASLLESEASLEKGVE